MVFTFQFRERISETDKATVVHYRRQLVDYAKTIAAVKQQKDVYVALRH